MVEIAALLQALELFDEALFRPTLCPVLQYGRHNDKIETIA